MISPALMHGSRRDGSHCRYPLQLCSQHERRFPMAAFSNLSMRSPFHEGSFSSVSLENVLLDDGTRVVTSPVTDIRRPVCAGIDVHKSVLMAAVCLTDTQTLKTLFYVRQFTSANSDIRRMAAWFLSFGVMDVCMESTGKYWIPVFDILEQAGLKPVLTHPKYVRQARGRKTDFRDAIHIASLFRMDLVSSSFIPPADIRDLRELCRYRLKLTYCRTAEKNRFQNSMTISKLRLDCVFTDPFGRSAQDIMSYLIDTPPEQVCDEKILSFIKPGVKASSKEILDSIRGYEFIGVQRDKLQIVQMHINDINKCISLIDNKLSFYRSKYSSILSHLATIPGISLESALYILGEIGADMSVWRDSDQLVSWAGLSPANNASAGRKKSTRIGNGGHYLKPLLVQCALAAVKSTKKQPYFYYKYLDLKKRRGHKKAVIAIARKMLVSIYHMIREDKDFHPTDYEQVVTRKHKPKELNLKNIIAFLGERGVDAETIHMVETQCSGTGPDQKDAATDRTAKSRQKKQSKPDAEQAVPPEHRTANKREPQKSHLTNNGSPKQPDIATA